MTTGSSAVPILSRYGGCFPYDRRYPLTAYLHVDAARQVQMLTVLAAAALLVQPRDRAGGSAAAIRRRYFGSAKRGGDTDGKLRARRGVTTVPL